jgi:hypothetical protein
MYTTAASTSSIEHLPYSAWNIEPYTNKYNPQAISEQDPLRIYIWKHYHRKLCSYIRWPLLHQIIKYQLWSIIKYQLWSIIKYQLWSIPTFDSSELWPHFGDQPLEMWGMFSFHTWLVVSWHFSVSSLTSDWNGEVFTKYPKASFYIAYFNLCVLVGKHNSG